MGIDHGGLEIMVAQQLLNRPNIVSIFQQVGGEAVSERVDGGLFCDPGFPYSNSRRASRIFSSRCRHLSSWEDSSPVVGDMALER